MARLSISLLGAFEASLDDRPIGEWVTGKARALLAYLAVERRRSLSREHLAGLLWPDQPEERARHSLRQALSTLRQALQDTDSTPEPFLLVARETIQLNPNAPCWLDVEEFTALAEANRRHRHRRPAGCRPCLARMERMETLYRDDFMPHSSYSASDLFDEWAALKREWLHREMLEALAALTDYHERRGAYRTARDLARRQLALDPWREEAHRQLMRLLALNGERSAALVQYETCRRVLAEELGVEPTAETEALFKSIRDETGRSLLSGLFPAPRIPSAPTPFIGRQAERAELAEWLADPNCRLVTLVGPGGVGKTRLALQVADDHVGLFSGGVGWVPLGAIAEEEMVIPAIAQALGFTLYGKEPPLNQVLSYLRDKSLLLVLDSVEHLAGIGALVDALLSRAPDVLQLVTARAPLALREERVYRVEGLPFPETPTIDAARYDAVALFTQSALRTAHRFAPDETDMPALVQICRLVEGLPLALEMAGAWIADRTCAQIAAEIAAGLDLLSTTLQNVPPHQRSVRATFEQSWRRLGAEEQRLFARLAVFFGFEPDAAAAVAGVDRSALTALAAKSLVRALRTGRYQLHGLLQQYAAEKLAGMAGEQESTAARHAAWYTELLERLEPALKSAGQEQALTTIDREIANVRRAWEWAVSGVANEHVAACAMLGRAADSLYLFFNLRSWYQEGAAALGRAVAAVEALAPAGAETDLLLGRLLARQARCMEFTAPAEAAIERYQRSLALFRRLGTDRETALPLYGLGYMAHMRGQYDEARRYFGESLECYQQAGDRWGTANVLSSLCLTARQQGAFAEARQYGLESLLIRREIGDRRGIASSQNNLGLVYCALGEYAPAESALRESVAICQEIGHTVGIANACTGLCHVALSAGDRDGAAHYQSQALQIFQEVGDYWGVAIAYNNLGQIALEAGDAARARRLFGAGVAVYRQVGIKAGLANTLNNLGAACLALGELREAAGYLSESLEIAHAIGDAPIALEILARAAVAWEQIEHDPRSLTVLAFALRQPEMLEETRRAATAAYARLRATFAPNVARAAETAARTAELATLVAEVLERLKSLPDL